MNIVEHIVNFFCITIFKFRGWKLSGTTENLPKKLIIVAAPHTSNWDGVYAKAAAALLNMKIKFAIKKEAFVFPLGYFFKNLGGIPIDRKKKTDGVSKNKEGSVDQIVNIFSECEELHFVLSPEGTRKFCEKWKTGFYYIAQKAQVKIAAAYIDYEQKEVGIWSEIIDTTEFSLEEIIDKLKNFYKTKKAKYPHHGIL